MTPLLASAEALALDARVQAAWGLDPLLLMEEAASRAFGSLRLRLATDPAFEAVSGKPALVAVAGGGANGGDALAMLRKARFAGWPVLGAVLASEAPGPAAAAQAAMLRSAGVALLSWSSAPEACRELLSAAGVILDGIAGAGLKGPLRGGPLALAEAVASAGRPVAAVDLPSGLGDGLPPEAYVLPATWTLSIEPRKAALYTPAFRARAGEILPVDGVFPIDASFGTAAGLLEERDLPALLPAEDRDAHKNRRGRLGVLAGSPGFVGAASLALQGASAAGVGYLSFFAGKELHPGLALSGAASIGASPGVVVEEAEALLSARERLDALLVGPGWRTDAEGAALLGRILESGLPCVLDASALRLLPDLLERGLRPRGPLVLTPHPGECAGFGYQVDNLLADPRPALAELARRSGASVALKASLTWLAEPGGEIQVYEGREPSLGQAGSGDVLAGLAAGLLARGVAGGARGAGGDAAWKALRAAVVAHGLAGKRLRRDRGWYPAEAIAVEAARILGGADGH